MEKQKDQKKNHSSKPNPKDKDDNSYIRLTSVTFEVLSLNLIIITGGYYLDKWVASSFPWVLMVFIFLSVIATIYYLLNRLKS